MAVSELLRLVIDADTSGAVRGINQLGVVSKRELTKSEQSIQKWGNALTTAGAGMIAIGAVGVLGLGRAAKASEDAHLSVVKLENTLQNMPALAGENSAQFIELADDIQSVTAADADQIVAAEAMLGTFRLTANEIKTITPLVVDYSRKFGVDLVSAATQVGKALDGNVTALKRNGVSIDEAAFATDRFGAVQQALADQVGGFAEAEGKTFAGSIARMKNELGDLAEGVGVGAVDAFSSMFGVVEGITSRFQELSPATQGLVGKLATFGSVGLIASGGLSILVGQAIKMHQTFGVMKDAITGVISRIRGLGAAGTALTSMPAVLLAVAAGFEMWNQQQQRMDVEKFTEQFLAAGESVEGMKDVMAALVESGPTQLVTVFNQLAESNKAAAERFIETAEAAGASDRVLDAMRGKLESVGAAEQQGAADAEALAESMGGVTEGTEEAVSALQAYSDTLTAMTDPQFGMIDAMQQSAAAQLELRDSTTALTEARASGDVDKIAEAEARYGEAVNGARSSVVDLQVAANKLKDSMEEQGLTAADVEAEFVALAQQQGFTADEALLMAQAFGVATDEANTLGRTDPNVDVSETGTAPTRERLRRTKEDAFAIPQARNVHVSATGYGNVAALVDRINAKMAALHDRTLTVRTNFVSTGQGGSGGIPLFHEGGVVPGRRGEEVAAILQAGERVVSLDDMDRKWVSGGPGGGGGGAVDQRTVIYQISNPDPQGVVEAIKRYERQNGRGWRN